MNIKIDINYYSHQYGEKKFSHKSTEEWEKVKLFCPKCGEQNVWHETGAGDYYADEQYMCATCGSSFYLTGGINERNENDDQNEQRFFVLSNSNQ